MKPVVRFVAALILGLAVLAWTASVAVSHTMRSWNFKDLAMRARLAVNSARTSLLFHWRDGDREAVRKLLLEIARDERIVAAAACDANHELVATPDFPASISCDAIRQHVTVEAPGLPEEWREWTSIAQVPGGRVFLSAIPVLDSTVPRGFVVLVHDLSYVDWRESKTQWFLGLVFGVLALGGSGVTLLAARLAWRGWTREMRMLLKGESSRPEFHPIMRDVLDLVERLSVERDIDSGAGSWTPQGLKQILARYFHGESLVVLANREPYVHQRSPDGSVTVMHPASGLVTALEPVIRSCSGVWVAHGSGTADRETCDPAGRIRVPPGQESYLLKRVWLSPEEEQGYYAGFANEGLWPLCLIAHTRPTFRSDDFRHYKAVNARFVEAILSEVVTDDPVVLIQDYHFALAPRMLREKLPRATIITFWHIPWPNAERFGICPWKEELLDGMLGSSIVGFHIQLHCNNFVEAVDRYLEARIDRETFGVVQRGLSTLVRAYPISLEWPSQWLTTVPSCDECRASVLQELGLPPDASIGVGVDRLDYVKGIEERFQAVERLLERMPALRGRFTFVQLAAPSRMALLRYRQLDKNLEALAARINERFGADGYRPVVLLKSHHEHPTVFRYYRAANVCYVSSLHDGMNLVAKEFVAARDDERGVLILSQFTGAARELTEALVVNPYDIERASVALETALNMSMEEQRERMRSMRAFLAEFNIYRWAGRMLIDANRVRRQSRLVGRLAERLRDGHEDVR